MSPEQKLLLAVFHGMPVKKTPTRTHFAWDYGLYTNLTSSNTIRTKCATVVSRRSINNKLPTCPVCLRAMLVCLEESKG